MSNSGASSRDSQFRERLLGHDLLTGALVKTPTVHATEILGDLGFDFVIVDAEHAPIDRTTIDHMILAARAWRLASVVRPASNSSEHLLTALDCGARGLLLPHVATPQQASALVAACRYRGGHRGISNSPRAARYGGASIQDHIDDSDRLTAIIALIEGIEGVNNAEAVAAVNGVDALFIGQGDLTLALGERSPDAISVRKAVETIAQAAIRQSKPVGALARDGNDAQWLRSIGVTMLALGTDQGFLRSAAKSMLSGLKA
ncbi:2-keto-3-deoxy-L-rhamnonate aldolase RhmA [Bradyrhizobium macuxiense]|uniref:2-keto-3-deoxy-L-rhamnonate aldolase RhmA n=1 Tax=Bradyrhizobium macuxiense TaxID=1755647 RepID=A0A560KX47_9BRAD|nr:aldolase/citrate lyase family protein [Bradyrhizobium macuxiense]TWB87795.1 2-keto-3-deoxy-L-rhamnonate aldolase RhmA [Bradyrhizobium macuxiense]